MAVNKGGMSPAAAGVVGAVVGAAVGAGAVVLSDEKNRKKIEKKFNEYKKDGQKIISDVRGKVEEMSAQGEKKVEDAKKAVKAKL
jgi:gas vesicle protein